MEYTNEIFDKTTLEVINNLITDTNFDKEIFDNWLKNNNVSFKSNPNSYIRKIFGELLARGVFRPKKYEISVEPLLLEMREKKITYTEEDTMFIYVMETYIIDHKIVSIKEVVDYNHKAIAFILEKKPKPTAKDFIEVFRKSKKFGKCFYNIDELYRRANGNKN